MASLSLEEYGVREIDSAEMSEIDGGWIWIGIGLAFGAFSVAYAIGYWWNHRR